MNGYNLDNVEELLSDIEHLRNVRKDVCFQVINRGTLWYEGLSEIQLKELKQWYQEWLNVTNTKIIPRTPNWIGF